MWQDIRGDYGAVCPLMTSSVEFIDLKAQYQSLKKQIDARIEKVLHHGQYIMGEEVRELEERLESYTESHHCISVSSGTDALFISLLSLGVTCGDEVITTPFTFVSTAEVIGLLGATPVFVDIEPDTCNINAKLIEQAITPRTKAIIPVSLYGQIADMNEINAIAARHGDIPVIEDGAQSFGATYFGQKSCNLSTIGCTSFFPSKPLGCYGDGGAIFTNNSSLATEMRNIRVHGQERRYHHTSIGVGGRMDTLQCAVLLAKLEKFEWEIQRRILLGQQYLSLIDGLAGVETLVVRDQRTCVWGQFTISLSDRDRVSSELKKEGIPTSVHYPVPLHRQPAYKDICRIAGDLSVADSVAEKVLSLPIHPYLDNSTQTRIVDALSRAIT